MFIGFCFFFSFFVFAILYVLEISFCIRGGNKKFFLKKKPPFIVRAGRKQYPLYAGSAVHGIVPLREAARNIFALFMLDRALINHNENRNKKYKKKKLYLSDIFYYSRWYIVMYSAVPAREDSTDKLSGNI